MVSSHATVPTVGTPVPVTGGGTAAPRRTRPKNRPRMVPLDQFGKTPPPPARQPIEWPVFWRNVAILAIFLLVVGWGVVVVTARSETIWSNAGNIDQRTGR
jgi:hypothetical protein